MSEISAYAGAMKMIGARIREARKAIAMTQAHLAEALGIARVNVTQWETGVTRPDVTRLPAIAAALKISTDALLGGKTHPLEVAHVHVRGDVQAGVWVESRSGFSDAGFDIDYIPSVPGKYRHLEQCAFRVIGPSMNKARLFDGDFVICVPYFMARASLQDGDTVVVERRRAGIIERTVKELQVKPGGDCLLWPRSDDPRFQQPISCTGPEPDGTEIEVTGLVIGVFSPR